MNTLRKALPIALLLLSQGAAAVQDVTGISCTASEWSLTTGPAFHASCEGDLSIDASSVLRADESIELRAERSLIVWGMLDAPRIVLYAGDDIQFHGNIVGMDIDIRVGAGTDQTNSLRGGAEISIGGASLDRIAGGGRLTGPISVELIVLPGSEIALAVPEPGVPALMGAGIVLVAFAARRRRNGMAHPDHISRNAIVTLEN